MKEFNKLINNLKIQYDGEHYIASIKELEITVFCTKKSEIPIKMQMELEYLFRFLLKTEDNELSDKLIKVKKKLPKYKKIFEEFNNQIL